MCKRSMYIMIDQAVYEQGLNIFEQLKYTIEYDKKPIQNIVLIGLCNRLLNSSYVDNDQKDLINKILKNVKKSFNK